MTPSPKAPSPVGAPTPSGQAASSPSFLGTVKAVLWSFFGVRKGRDHAADMERLNPIHVVIAGVLLAALFVFTLLQIIGFIVK